MMTRLWMNHWFSTAYNIINLIKGANPEIVVVGTDEREESPMKPVCDEWFQEPVLEAEEYVEFCLEFCRNHEIDVFMPRRHMLAISRYGEKFKQNGVKVMVDDYQYVSMLNRKDLAYDHFRRKGIGFVPEYQVVNDVRTFKAAYDSLSRRYKRVCFKFVEGEGGKSYRQIDDKHKGFKTLSRKQTTRMTLEDAMQALSEKPIFPRLMVMPNLPGDEVSVDCLKTASGLIAIPRIKGTSRVERVEYDEGILSLCEMILDDVPLEMPCNIQFKYLDGIPYLLEVNTRMSGGTHMACAASGVNIPSIAINKLLGVNLTWSNNMEEHLVTQVETPIVLD